MAETTTRLLPPDEWDRLDQTALRDVLDGLIAKREHVAILVAERDGAIVGHAVFASWVHVEGMASDRPSTMFRLLDGIKTYCADHGIDGVWSGADSVEMEGLLRWQQAEPIPGRQVVWYPTRTRSKIREESCQSQS